MIVQFHQPWKEKHIMTSVFVYKKYFDKYILEKLTGMYVLSNNKMNNAYPPPSLERKQDKHL